MSNLVEKTLVFSTCSNSKTGIACPNFLVISYCKFTNNHSSLLFSSLLFSHVYLLYTINYIKYCVVSNSLRD